MTGEKNIVGVGLVFVKICLAEIAVVGSERIFFACGPEKHGGDVSKSGDELIEWVGISS